MGPSAHESPGWLLDMVLKQSTGKGGQLAGMIDDAGLPSMTESPQLWLNLALTAVLAQHACSSQPLCLSWDSSPGSLE